MDTYNQNAWAAFSPSSTNSLEGVFEFAKQWNAVFAKQGSSIRFNGIVLDYEEFYGSRAPSIMAEAQDINPLKAAYGMQAGITFGYQAWSSMADWDSTFDDFYLQFYDYYYSPSVDTTDNSPFLLYKNDPQTLADFTVKTVLQGYSEDPSRYGSKVRVMWSLQNMANTCIYPLNDGSCGINYEFGAGWTAEAVNEYLKAFRQSSPHLGSKPQGFFQFSFVPLSWMLSH